MTYPEVASIFELLDKWRHLPAYQLERRCAGRWRVVVVQGSRSCRARAVPSLRTLAPGVETLNLDCGLSCAHCGDRDHPFRRERALQNRRIFASEWLSATASPREADGVSSFCSPYSLNHASPVPGSTLTRAYALCVYSARRSKR